MLETLRIWSRLGLSRTFGVELISPTSNPCSGETRRLLDPLSYGKRSADGGLFSLTFSLSQAVSAADAASNGASCVRGCSWRRLEPDFQDGGLWSKPSLRCDSADLQREAT